MQNPAAGNELVGLGECGERGKASLSPLTLEGTVSRAQHKIRKWRTVERGPSWIALRSGESFLLANCYWEIVPA
jgi:hypothetical protein